MFGIFWLGPKNLISGTRKKRAIADRNIKARNDNEHRVFNLIIRGMSSLYIIFDLDDEIPVIPWVWFTREQALDFFALLWTR